MEALERHGIHPAKGLGQSFVVDPNTIRKVVSAARLDPADRVLEIGAGPGSLTVALASSARSVVAVELDARLLPVLKEMLSGADNVEVVEGDALQLDLGSFKANRLVANLPYYIAATLVVKTLVEGPGIQSLTVMTQKEVGERLAAEPGSRSYGQTSVMVRYFAGAEVVGRISRRAFHPIPNVDSVLVRIVRSSERVGSPHEIETFFTVVRSAFQQRRKTLRNSLAGLAGSASAAAALLEQAGVDPGHRPEDLGVDSFIQIAQELER
jgi:16S rRNA (adenine1518-N6/adenine1519-N6)-dimethyltransferase